MTMNEMFSAKWHIFKGQTLKTWGKLTHSDVEKINGSREFLIGKIMDKYHKSFEEARQEVDRFMEKAS